MFVHVQWWVILDHFSLPWKNAKSSNQAWCEIKHAFRSQLSGYYVPKIGILVQVSLNCRRLSSRHFFETRCINLHWIYRPLYMYLLFMVNDWLINVFTCFCIWRHPNAKGHKYVHDWGFTKAIWCVGEGPRLAGWLRTLVVDVRSSEQVAVIQKTLLSTSVFHKDQSLAQRHFLNIRWRRRTSHGRPAVSPVRWWHAEPKARKASWCPSNHLSFRRLC